MVHPNTTICGSARRDYGNSCGCGHDVPLLRTIDRHYTDARNLLDTLEATGEVVTTLSTIGMTTVRNGVAR